MVQGQVNLKRGLAFFLFGFFKFYHFYKEKLFYFLQNCVIHLKTICRENKNLKKGGKLGQGVGSLKKGAETPLQTKVYFILFLIYLDFVTR